MTTAYKDLYEIAQSSDPSVSVLNKQLAVAVVVKAQVIIALGATSTASQKAWAQSALKDPTQYVHQLLLYALAANQTLTLAAIQAGIADATVQTNVNSAVDAIYV